MLKRIILVAVAALAATLIPAPAHAVTGSGYFDPVGTVQLKDSGCFYVPYYARLSVGAGASSWDVDTRILYPNGTVFDEGFDYGSGSGNFVDSEEMLFCSSIDPAGTYTMSGKLTVYDASYNKTEFALAPSSFQVLPYAPPPLPNKNVKGKAPHVAKYAYLRKFAVTFSTKPTPVGYQEGKAYAWTVFINGRKVKKLVEGAGETKYWTSSTLPVGKVQKLVIKGNGAVRYQGKMTPK
jgi:hypothetical protein